MNHLIFFFSTLLIIAFIYHILLKHFFDKSKDKFDKWAKFAFISFIIFVVNWYAFVGLAEIENTSFGYGYPIGATIGMLILRVFFDMIFDMQDYFTSTEEKDSIKNPFHFKEFKKVVEDDAKKISIYPRITIWRVPSHELIFDSSDFAIINKTFGTFNDISQSFAVGEEFKFKDTTLIAEKVKVDLLSFYDDYVGGTLGGGHTKVYEGRDIPYNIQVIIWVKEDK